MGNGYLNQWDFVKEVKPMLRTEWGQNRPCIIMNLDILMIFQRLLDGTAIAWIVVIYYEAMSSVYGHTR